MVISSLTVITHSLTHSLTHLITYLLTYLLNYLLTRWLTQSLTLTYSLTLLGILPDDEKEKYETGKKLITLNMRQETLNAEIAGSNRKLLPMNNKSENDDGST